jgi:hypothetical protein
VYIFEMLYRPPYFPLRNLIGSTGDGITPVEKRPKGRVSDTAPRATDRDRTECFQGHNLVCRPLHHGRHGRALGEPGAASPAGFEPAASWSATRCAVHCTTETRTLRSGGGNRTRLERFMRPSSAPALLPAPETKRPPVRIWDPRAVSGVPTRAASGREERPGMGHMTVSHGPHVRSSLPFRSFV